MTPRINIEVTRMKTANRENSETTLGLRLGPVEIETKFGCREHAFHAVFPRENDVTNTSTISTHPVYHATEFLHTAEYAKTVFLPPSVSHARL